MVDGFDFLTDHLGIVLELLHLTVHLVDEAVAFLAGDVEEPEVVLIRCDLLLELIVTMHKVGALTVDGFITLLRHAAKVVLEVVEMALGSRDVQVLVDPIHHIMVLLVNLIFLTERNMPDSIVFVGELLHLLACVLACIRRDLLQFLNDVALLLKILFLFSMCAGMGSVARVKELVAGCEEVVPQLVTDLARHGADGLPLFLQLDELIGGCFPIRRVGELLRFGDESLLLLGILVEAGSHLLEIFGLTSEEIVAGLAEALEDLLVALLRRKADSLPLLLDGDNLFGVFLPVGSVFVLLFGDSFRLLAERRLLGEVLLLLGAELFEVL